MDSPCESESSLDGGSMLPPSPVSREQLQKRIESLTQQNKVLKVELDSYKMRVKVLYEENRNLRQASVFIHAKAEQEEEYISNTLLKKIQSLKKEKETLAHHFEREEECLTNDLSRKLDQLRQEKCKLEQTLEQEQECLVNKLMRKIEKLEAETTAKQKNLEQLRDEMIELENTLEQEQEALVNKLWKRMDKLEAEKRSLQVKLDQPVSNPVDQSDIVKENGTDTASTLSIHIHNLSAEVSRLRSKLETTERETTEKLQQFAQDEKCIREENLRLQRKLQLEVERREALSRHLSESESSLEMEEERFYNENVFSQRQRTISSPIPHSPTHSRPLSPGIGVSGTGQHNTQQTNRCYSCGQMLGIQTFLPLTNVFHPIVSTSSPTIHGSGRRTSERFVKPAIPTPSIGLNTSAPNVFGSSSGSSSSGMAGIGGGSGSNLQYFGMGGSGNLLANATNNILNNSLPSSTTATTTTTPPSSSASSSSSTSSSTSHSSSSIASSSNNNINNISFSGNNSAFAQPASPMDTSVCKD